MAEKPKDLEERTAEFAEAVRAFVRILPRTVANIEDVKRAGLRIGAGQLHRG